MNDKGEMNCMKLFVEMSDKEYEEYQQFLNGTHPSQEQADIKSMSVLRYLELKGFAQKEYDETFDIASRRNVSIIKLEKDNITVMVRIMGD